MKSILFCALLCTPMLIYAQTFEDGLYVNEEWNSLVMIKNDTLRFRLNSGSGILRFHIGESVLEKEKKKWIIHPLPSLTEKTSVLYRYPRNDNHASIQAQDPDGQPVRRCMDVTIWLSQDEKFYFKCADKPLLLLEDSIFDHKQAVLVNINTSAFETEKRIRLERGYDYVFRSRISARFPFFINKGSWGYKIEISQLEKNKIRLEDHYFSRKYRKLKRIGYLSTAIMDFRKIADDNPLSDFPYDIDVKQIVAEENKTESGR